MTHEIDQLSYEREGNNYGVIVKVLITILFRVTLEIRVIQSLMLTGQTPQFCCLEIGTKIIWNIAFILAGRKMSYWVRSTSSGASLFCLIFPLYHKAKSHLGVQILLSLCSCMLIEQTLNFCMQIAHWRQGCTHSLVVALLMVKDYFTVECSIPNKSCSLLLCIIIIYYISTSSVLLGNTPNKMTTRTWRYWWYNFSLFHGCLCKLTWCL